MKIKCIIIEDEPLATTKLSSFISKVSWLQLEECFDCATKALSYLKQHSLVQLIFLDIHMDDFSGMQFLKLYEGNARIIITSAYQQYALEGYEYQVTDYLLKPFGLERFMLSMNKVFAHFQEKASPDKEYLFIKSGYNFERVNIKDILYIEGMNEYLQIVTANNKLMTLQSFNQLEQLLPPGNFIRVHKSYMVAIDKIEKVQRLVIIIGNKRIPVGKSYKERFLEFLAG